MDDKEALELADELVYTHTGKHLNDLEREVFLGSLKGQTYEEIYPLNPQYIEKDVGYKLWKKLSSALDEKVTKKNFRGALERAKEAKQSPIQDTLLPSSQNVAKVSSKRVFISYRSQEPDTSLAVEFYEMIKTAGYEAFMANFRVNSEQDIPDKGKDWLAFIDEQLQQSDYFLVLLSPQVAVSEMVIEELRRVRELHSLYHKPIVLPIRIHCPLDMPLNHDLRGYLDNIQQYEWTSPADTATLAQEVLSRLAGSDTKRWNNTSEEFETHTPHSTLRETATASTPLTPPCGKTLSCLNPSLPLPVAEPELPNGQVRLASAFYVERSPYEALCYKEILHPGSLIRIKAPRQMGKTSLMARILYQAKEQGYRTVPLSFQHADTAVFTDLNQLLRWFCARISRKLKLPYQLDDYWTDTFGSKDNCTIYFEDCLLSESDSPLVLGLDEVDRVFQYPKIADDFFGLLRAWYEEAGYGDGSSELWQKLRLVVVHSTEVYIPLNVNQSPFNVGLPIELPDFSPQQVQDLTQRHGLHWSAMQIEKLMRLVGGHPYLVRLALYHIAQQTITLEQLLQTAPTEAGLYDDHLRRHLWNLQQHPELATAFAKAVTADIPVELESVTAFKLHSMGLVQLQGNSVTPRCDLYRLYFCDRLGKS